MSYILIAIVILYFMAFSAFWFYLFYPRFGAEEQKPEPKEPALPQKGKKPGFASRIGRRIVPAGYAEYLKRQLLYAGSSRGLNLDRTLSRKVWLAFSGAILFLPILITGFTVIRFLIFLAVIVIAFFLPDVWLSSRSDKRQKQLGRDLPDVIDLLAVSVEAGLGFDSALTKVIETSKGPVTEEFFRLLQEIQLGISRKQAFHNLAERTTAPEFRYFILAMIQADAFGISIGKVLRAQSVEMKQKRRQKAEEAAVKAPVKIIFPLLLCIFPALMIVILGPAGIRIAQTLSQTAR